MGCDGCNKLYILLVICTYWFVSITMVYLNKVLMTNYDASIPAPLFITWYQCVITSVICWLAGICGERAQLLQQSGYSRLSTDENNNMKHMSLGSSNSSTGTARSVSTTFCAQFPRQLYSASTAIKIFPLSFIFVGMITFNAICLKFVQVSFYNVARSLTIVFNVLFSWLLLGIPSTAKTLACLLIVIGGFYIGVEGEVNFSMIGTTCGVISSLFVSLNSIFTKKVLSTVDDNHWRLTWYNNVNACILLIPLVYYFESDIIASHTHHLFSGPFWCAMTMAGFFGFAIGIVTVLQIKATSPLTHNISGTAKALVQSMMAFHIWGNPPTMLGVLGIFTVLGGSLLYTYVKMNECKQIVTQSNNSVDVESQERG